MDARHNLRITAAVVCGLAGSLAVGAPAALAQEQPVVVEAAPQDVRIEHVRYADLDLRMAADERRLMSRVGGAIERVCELDLGRDGLQDNGYYRCAGFAWSDAQSQIGKAVTDARSLALNAATTAITVRAIAR